MLHDRVAANYSSSIKVLKNAASRNSLGRSDLARATRTMHGARPVLSLTRERHVEGVAGS